MNASNEQRLPALTLTEAFSRMKAAIEQASGSPLKDNDKNQQKIGDALAVFYNQPSWYTLCKSVKDGTLTDESCARTPSEQMLDILIPATAKVLLEIRAYVSFAIGFQENIHHYMTTHDIKGMDEGFNSYWKHDIGEAKRDKFIKLFNTNEELVNMTPEMAKDQFRMITPVSSRLLEDAMFIFREIGGNLIYTLGNLLMSDNEVARTMVDAMTNDDALTIERLLWRVGHDAL